MTPCCAKSNGTEGVPLVKVDIGLLTDQVGVSAPYTLDLCQGVHDLHAISDCCVKRREPMYHLLFAIDVGVEETEDELEVRLLARYERHLCGLSMC